LWEHDYRECCVIGESRLNFSRSSYSILPARAFRALFSFSIVCFYSKFDASMK
jgi:hypothetical protein